MNQGRERGRDQWGEAQSGGSVIGGKIIYQSGHSVTICMPDQRHIVLGDRGEQFMQGTCEDWKGAH